MNLKSARVHGETARIHSQIKQLPVGAGGPSALWSQFSRPGSPRARRRSCVLAARPNQIKDLCAPRDTAAINMACP